VHQGGLAGAVLAEQGVDLAGLDDEIDVAVRHQVAEALGDATQLKSQGILPAASGRSGRPPTASAGGRRRCLLCLSVRSAGRFGALPSLLATLVSPDSAAPRSTMPVGPLRGALRCAAFPPRYARQSRQRRDPLCSLRLGRRADLHLTADDV